MPPWHWVRRLKKLIYVNISRTHFENPVGKVHECFLHLLTHLRLDLPQSWFPSWLLFGRNLGHSFGRDLSLHKIPLDCGNFLRLLEAFCLRCWPQLGQTWLTSEKGVGHLLFQTWMDKGTHIENEHGDQSFTMRTGSELNHIWSLWGFCSKQLCPILLTFGTDVQFVKLPLSFAGATSADLNHPAVLQVFNSGKKIVFP